jgi:tetratricopeptide (TPR) repeat protein
MLQQLPEELARARELMAQAKFEEAFEIIEQLEKDESLSPEDQLSVLLIKGLIFAHTREHEKLVKNSERTYQLSQDLGLVPESVQALIGKAYIVFIGDLDKAFAYITNAERRLKSLADEPSTEMLRRDLLLIKSWTLFFRGNTKEAEESALECLKLTEEIRFGNKLRLAAVFYVLGWIKTMQQNQTKALEYAMKSLEIHEELNHSIAIGNNYSLIAQIYRQEGDYNQAIQYCKLSLSKELTKASRLTVLGVLSEIYNLKNELRRVLRYRKRALALAEELNNPLSIIPNLVTMGFIYNSYGKNDLVIEYFDRGLSLSERYGVTHLISQSLAGLTIKYIEVNSREIANRYFSRLTELYNKTKQEDPLDVTTWYLGAKAYMLKTSTRMRDHVEAQALYKELINILEGLELPLKGEGLYSYCLGNLCDLLLEELSMFNDPEILDEITPIITKILEMAERVRNYAWLAEAKLLQAKLALIQMNIKEAKRLMIEAQRIADLHGLNLLASKISSEHDKLLEHVDVWDKIKKEEAPMAERVKLASTSGVLERMQGKRAVAPPELVEEKPILLLIMDNSGATYFNHPFITNWDHSDLFSSFMSAFNTFMDEIFSNSIDRIKVKENTILINPVENFLVCYVIRGQSYPALQKLTRFTEAIRENPEIWLALNKSVKTSEMLELDKPPTLKTLIDKIF